MTNQIDVAAILEQGHAHLARDQAHAALADFQQAAELCQRATNLAEAPHILAAVYLYQSRAALHAGELETALYAADQALELQPESVDGLLQRAVVWVAGTNWEEAQNDLEQAFSMAEQDSRIPSLYATVQYQMGDVEAAFATLEDAMAQYPKDAQLWLIRGELQLAQGETARAKKDFLKAVKLDKTLPQAYPFLGYFALQEGKLDGAEEILLAGLRFGAKNADLHLQLAHVHLAQARWQDALQEAERHLELKPTSAAGYAAQAEVYRHTDELEKAFHASQHALRLSPQDPHILWQHAVLALQTQQAPLALATLGQLLQGQPDHMEAHRLRAELLASGGFDLFWRVWQTEDYAHLVAAWLALRQFPHTQLEMLPLHGPDSRPFLAVRLTKDALIIDVWVDEHYFIRRGETETSAPLDAKILIATVKELGA